MFCLSGMLVGGIAWVLPALSQEIKLGTKLIYFSSQLGRQAFVYSQTAAELMGDSCCEEAAKLRVGLFPTSGKGFLSRLLFQLFESQFLSFEL